MGARPEDRQAFLDSLRIAAGDTAYLYESLAHRAYGAEQPPDTSDVRAMLHLMRDPSIAWGFNVSHDYLYNLVQALVTWPRAEGRVDDSHFSSCTPAACRLLGDQWLSSRDGRIRDVGLVALMSMDPRRWADTVLALSGARHPLLRSAAQLARGVGATWYAASNAPIPPPNSDWQAWLEWMNGPRLASPVRPPVRFEESHRTAIRFYTARTGRDVVGELLHSYGTARTDSARLVFGAMLQQLNALRLAEGGVADGFASGVPERIHLAREMLLSSFGNLAAPMSEANAAPLLDRVIGVLVGTTSLWPAGTPDLRTAPIKLPGVHAAIGHAYVETKDVTEALHAKWAGHVEFVRPSEWDKADPRAGGVVYTLHPILSWGRFARVEVTLSERVGRAAGETPSQFASGTTYYLEQVGGEWVVVAVDGWIT